jgi:hypothetical protein
MTTTDSPTTIPIPPAHSFAARVTPDTGGSHSTVDVFAGPDADHRAFCGRIVMRADEAQAFAALLGEARR